MKHFFIALCFTTLFDIGTRAAAATATMAGTATAPATATNGIVATPGVAATSDTTAKSATLMKKRVFVTAFQPFLGAKANATIEIAAALKQRLASQNIDVAVCVLPVIYDQAALEAEGCYRQLNATPDLVVSLGEAGCKVRLETAAHNQDHSPGDRDNRGEIRLRGPIDRHGPDSIGFDSRVVDMYCSLPKDVRTSQIEVSRTPNGYVCNNTAYHLGQFFKDERMPYTFIHVPTYRCSEKGLIERSGAIVASMIATILQPASAGDAAGPVGTETDSAIGPFLPTTVSEVNEVLKLVNGEAGSEKNSCKSEFMWRLRGRMMPPRP